MARGKGEPNAEQGKRSAERMPRSPPCTAGVTVAFTGSGCGALGSCENLPGPQQHVTPEMTRMGFGGWRLHHHTEENPSTQEGSLNRPAMVRGLQHRSRPREHPGKARVHQFQSQEPPSAGPSCSALSRVTNTQKSDLGQ